MGKLGYFSCTSLSRYSAACRPPQAILALPSVWLSSRDWSAPFRAAQNCSATQDWYNVCRDGGAGDDQAVLLSRLIETRQGIDSVADGRHAVPLKK